MNLIILKIFISFLFGYVYSESDKNLTDDWDLFKKKIKLSIKNPIEDIKQRLEWQKNYDYVNKHNLECELKKTKYKLKLNDFAYMDTAEFLRKKTGLKLTSKRIQKKRNEYVKRDILNSNRPEEYDGRKYCPIPIRDQLDCGGCYSFAAVFALECQYARNNTFVSLSEQNLIDCTRKFGNYGCDGGAMDQAFEYIQANRGINLLSFYRYRAKEGLCKFRSRHIGANLKSYKFVETEDELEDAIYNYGAVSCGIDASLKSFQLYSSGIYNDTDCSTKEINHAINVVGYTREYFICRNSWGTNWGMDGYFFLPKGINACGVSKQFFNK